MYATLINKCLQASWETLFMVMASGLLATLAGIPLAVLLYTTQPNGLLANRLFHRSLGTVINITRSIPFIILLILVIPVTRFLVGTSLGTLAAVVPLSLAALPFVARVVANALESVPSGLTETGLAMGATPLQIIWRMILPEALPGIIHAVTVTLITLVGYSAMAGAIGAGGLGNLAISEGYQRFDITVMTATVVILVAMVQLLQVLGDALARRYQH